MNKILFAFLKPKAVYAKWLIFLLLVGVMYLGASGHFENIQKELDTEQLTFKAGDVSISAYDILKTLITVIVIFWVTAIISEFSERRVTKLRKVRAANKVLIQKAMHAVIYFIAFLLTMNILGISLSSLTILSGAIGIGLGFGLQKIASNFVSGIILLLERSLEPGDLIELQDGTFGYVRKSSARATLIETIDGKEVLVPNEEFIINQVVNWTLTNPKARITLNFGVSYGCDIEKARDLALEAIKEHEKCLQDPGPVVWLDNFGDSSVDFIAYMWVGNVNEGFRSVKSAALFAIWNKFKENDIEIPFPQRDLHVKTLDNIKVEK